ncbi:MULTISPECIES: hypothetical protein [unclassified Nocardia]|uniref:hypothetical protein n=1 Tax=unclassified Nocardia TaxID=2637762 RepID=UPI001CE443C1|nr:MULTISPECIES: hypothetical protein [unclassified Nocardia]
MTDDRPSGRSRRGTPTSFVLYRTPGGWRHATYLRDPASILDGYLRDIPPTAAVEEAQAELHRRAELAHERKFHVRWEPADKPDWWTAEVTDAGPLPEDENNGQRAEP